MRTLRRALFYAFLALYLAATPLTILYALGYLYRPGHERGLVRSGLISLDTTPSGARVYVGASRFAWRTPTVIRGLVPGQYHLRLTLPWHRPWTGTVTVQAEKATVLDDIILLPEPLAPQVLDEQPFDELVARPGPDLFVLSRGERADGLWVYDADEETLHPLLPTNAPQRTARVVQRYLVEGSPYVLLALRDGGRVIHLWSRLDRDDPPLDVSRLFPQPPHRILWDRHADDEAFTFTDGQVDRLDFDKLAIYPAVLSRMLSVGVYRDHLYAIDQSNQFIRTTRAGEDPERAGKSPSEVNTFWGSRSGYSMLFVDEDWTLFLGDEGELFANREPYHFDGRDLLGLALHPKEKSVLVWDRHRLGRLDLAPDEEAGGAALPRIRWLREEQQGIEHAAWVNGGSHVAYAAGGQLYLLAVHDGSDAQPVLLTGCREHTPFFFSDRTGCFYFLDEQRRLTALRVLPRRELLPRSHGRENDEREPTP